MSFPPFISLFIIHVFYLTLFPLRQRGRCLKGRGWMEQWDVTSQSRDLVDRFRRHVPSTGPLSYAIPLSLRPARDPFHLSTSKAYCIAVWNVPMGVRIPELL